MISGGGGGEREEGKGREGKGERTHQCDVIVCVILLESELDWLV